MAIRIYALAKQLRLDSKALVDICSKIGITGKGSALASLSDDEVATLKAHLGGGAKKSPAGGKPAAAPPAGTASEPPRVMRREDYIAPGGALPKKVPSLADKVEKPASEKASSGEGSVDTKPPDRSGPAIKLAPMPAAQQPSPKPKSNEPAPQKPDIKLPPDAIRASKAGGTPLSEHLRTQEEKKSSGKSPAAPKKRAAPGGAAPAETAAQEKDRGRRGGRVAAAKAPEGEVTLGGREQRQLKRKRATPARRRSGEDDRGSYRHRTRRLRRTGNTSTAAPRKSNVVIQLPCTVRSFSESLGLAVHEVQAKLLELNILLTITANLDAETAYLLAEALEAKVDFRHEVDLEESLISAAEQEDAPETLKPRPPVVTFLGHVDHGKTSLLDRIIGTDVVAGEKGGITQHIRAYRVSRDEGAVAFVDTPGHEAFTAMRARGANCTDIAVLVVAADDGVMPQTEEAISHARAAGVPIVVALNKIDLPGVNIDRALQELAANELLPSEWGGDVEVVRTSATTGEGVDDLLDTLLTVAELHEYKANPDRPAAGICLEAEVQQGRGVVAKVLVQKGTLRVGDVVVCGPAHGRIKAMYNTLNPRKKHKEAGPSTPVNLTGLNLVPGAGDQFNVLDDIIEARQIAEQRSARSRQKELSGVETHVTLENLLERMEGQGETSTLNIILRADVRGSIEAICKELTKLDHPEVQIKILQKSVGGISEADVHLADASDAVIIGFNVVPDEGARMLAEQTGVQIRRYDIIYRITEDLRAALEGMLKPEKREADLGRALVQQTFHISRIGTVAGCRVLSGIIQRDSRVRVIRESRVIGDYPLHTLRREKDDAREVREGLECGMKLNGFNDVKEGDIFEVYKIEEVARTF